MTQVLQTDANYVPTLKLNRADSGEQNSQAGHKRKRFLGQPCKFTRNIPSFQGDPRILNYYNHADAMRHEPTVLYPSESLHQMLLKMTQSHVVANCVCFDCSRLGMLILLSSVCLRPRAEPYIRVDSRAPLYFLH